MKYALIFSLLLTSCGVTYSVEPQVEQEDDRACYLDEPVRIIEMFELTAIIEYEETGIRKSVYAEILDDPMYCRNYEHLKEAGAYKWGQATCASCI